MRTLCSFLMLLILIIKRISVGLSTVMTFFRRNFIRILLILLIYITAQRAKSDMEDYIDYCVIVQ